MLLLKWKWKLEQDGAIERKQESQSKTANARFVNNKHWGRDRNGKFLCDFWIQMNTLYSNTVRPCISVYLTRFRGYTNTIQYTHVIEHRHSVRIYIAQTERSYKVLFLFYILTTTTQAWAQRTHTYNGILCDPGPYHLPCCVATKTSATVPESVHRLKINDVGVSVYGMSVFCGEYNLRIGHR